MGKSRRKQKIISTENIYFYYKKKLCLLRIFVGIHNIWWCSALQHTIIVALVSLVQRIHKISISFIWRNLSTIQTHKKNSQNMYSYVRSILKISFHQKIWKISNFGYECFHITVFCMGITSIFRFTLYKCNVILSIFF